MKWDAVVVPKVAQVEETRQFVGDTDRAVSGKLLTSSIATKRVWIVTTTVLSPTEYSAVIDALDTSVWGEGELWLDEFGLETNTVTARADPTTLRVNTQNVGINGVWEKWARTITFRVEEV